MTVARGVASGDGGTIGATACTRGWPSMHYRQNGPAVWQRRIGRSTAHLTEARLRPGKMLGNVDFAALPMLSTADPLPAPA